MEKDVQAEPREGNAGTQTPEDPHPNGLDVVLTVSKIGVRVGTLETLSFRSQRKKNTQAFKGNT